ncbi:uncharacterized protein LOC142225676 [Haematobia irritans]|uniref:uncharacterized protein LOC142225676 n=1 Tax=Haematobia irritans TaxID=7368 RepID=UPI003F4FBE13
MLASRFHWFALFSALAPAVLGAIYNGGGGNEIHQAYVPHYQHPDQQLLHNQHQMVSYDTHLPNQAPMATGDNHHMYVAQPQGHGKQEAMPTVPQISQGATASYLHTGHYCQQKDHNTFHHMDDNHLKESAKDPKNLKNGVYQYGAMTYDLGLPHYEVMNPHDPPEIITSDHPQYHEHLAHLQRTQNYTFEDFGFRPATPSPIEEDTTTKAPEQEETTEEDTTVTEEDTTVTEEDTTVTEAETTTEQPTTTTESSKELKMRQDRIEKELSKTKEKLQKLSEELKTKCDRPKVYTSRTKEESVSFVVARKKQSPKKKVNAAPFKLAHAKAHAYAYIGEKNKKHGKGETPKKKGPYNFYEENSREQDKKMNTKQENEHPKVNKDHAPQAPEHNHRSEMSQNSNKVIDSNNHHTSPCAQGTCRHVHEEPQQGSATKIAPYNFYEQTPREQGKISYPPKQVGPSMGYPASHNPLYNHHNAISKHEMEEQQFSRQSMQMQSDQSAPKKIAPYNFYAENASAQGRKHYPNKLTNKTPMVFAHASSHPMPHDTAGNVIGKHEGANIPNHHSPYVQNFNSGSMTSQYHNGPSSHDHHMYGPPKYPGYQTTPINYDTFSFQTTEDPLQMGLNSIRRLYRSVSPNKMKNPKMLENSPSKSM